ncbi:MAG TPA: hypothetical protein VN923_05425, partial [Thermoanaerobaculia bacterium]|nr:hypothetical protein [Thermoanaerobaculia bacterium]
MSIELQIRASTMAAIAARAVQARLWETCFAPFPAGYLDRADVAGPIEVVAANATVRLRVPVELYVVSRAAVLAAPNAVPAGATAPTGTVVVVLELAVNGALVSLRCVDVELGALAGVLGADAAAAKETIRQAVGSPAAADLTTTLQRLGMSAPSSSRVELVAGVVSIRFEPAGSAVDQLFPGQEWGMFLDGRAVERLAISRVPVNLGARITSLNLEAHWRPAGTTPHVDIDYAGKAQVPDPFAGDVDGTLACDFSLTPTITKLLRTTVHWSLHIDLGDAVPGFVDDLVEGAIAAALNPTKFGGTAIGNHAFTIDSPLPEVAFGGARCGYTSVLASPAGMTIGGLVRLPADAGKDTVHLSVHAFGLPSRLYLCRELARSGSGVPPSTVTIAELSTSARVWLDSSGAICDLEIVSPGDWIRPYIRRPAETPEIDVVIPSAVALGIVQPVRIVVRTSRGVRLVDLGTPPAVEVDANGNVTNAVRSYIDNCLYITVGQGRDHVVGWGSEGGQGLDLDVLVPPLEHPDWATFLSRHRGIDVQLMTLSALEPGELIQFRSRDHAVDVTADRLGRALVPVLLPLADNAAPASLIRVNRRPIDGRFSVESTTFLSQASLPAGSRNSLSAV